jgi:GNAT superfamily N-acetyltransferase
MRRERGSFGFFVAEEGGEVLGAAVYFFAYYTWVGKSLYLDDLYVKPEHRRRKVGSMLLAQVFDLARREGCKRLRLQVLDWNKDAISFYEKHGGSITGEWLTCDFDAGEIARSRGAGPRPRARRSRKTRSR